MKDRKTNIVYPQLLRVQFYFFTFIASADKFFLWKGRHTQHLRMRHDGDNIPLIKLKCCEGEIWFVLGLYFWGSHIEISSSVGFLPPSNRKAIGLCTRSFRIGDTHVEGCTLFHELLQDAGDGNLILKIPFGILVLLDKKMKVGRGA